jgi:hypothetical protein
MHPYSQASVRVKSQCNKCSQMGSWYKHLTTPQQSDSDVFLIMHHLEAGRHQLMTHSDSAWTNDITKT